MEGHSSKDLKIITCLFCVGYCMTPYLCNIRHVERNANSFSAAKLAIVWTISVSCSNCWSKSSSKILPAGKNCSCADSMGS